MLEKLIPASGLKVDYSGGPSEGSSDHTSFTAHQVPALFFFSGLHGDYHKPSDTWDKIDAPAAAKLLALVAEVTESLRDAAGPSRVRQAGRAHTPHGGDSNPGPVSGYGPYFGSIPDFAEGIIGVKFADVREGSPAAKAGLKAGDIMVEFDGKALQNLYDFTYALRGKKPGDEVKVKVMRDGKPLEVQPARCPAESRTDDRSGSTTMDVYARAIPNCVSAAVEALDAKLCDACGQRSISGPAPPSGTVAGVWDPVRTSISWLRVCSSVRSRPNAFTSAFYPRASAAPLFAVVC